MFRVPLTYLKTCLAAFICSSVGQGKNCARNDILYARSGLLPVTRYMRDPIIDWYVVSCSFGCSVVPFVRMMPFGMRMDTVFVFSIPNRERIVLM